MRPAVGRSPVSQERSNPSEEQTVTSEHESPDTRPTQPADPAAPATAPDAAEPPAPVEVGREDRQDRQESGQRPASRTRISGAWTAVAVAAVVLLLLLIFILQNLQTVRVTFFGASGQLPLGVAVLLAAVGGALLVVVLGAARMIQLRAFARRERRRHERDAVRQSG
jgi:uncharacterized integral membrane protein